MMRTSRKNMLGACLLIALFGAGGYAAHSVVALQDRKETSQDFAGLGQSIEEIQAERGKPVRVATVEQKPLAIRKRFYGTVTPHAEANVQGKYGGKIVLLNAKEGDAVAAGEIIVRFDESDTQLQLQQAIAAKNAAIQAVKQAESTFNTTQTDFRRYQQLLHDGFVSKQTVDALRNQLQVTQAGLQRAREQVKTADVQIRLLNNMLKDLKISAPISGIIDEKHFQLSEIAGAGDVIYHLVDLDLVYVEVEIPELYISRICEQMDVDVMVDSLKEHTFSGSIERIIPTGNPQSRQFIAKVLVANPEHAIKPGMFARVSVCLERLPAALVLNQKALIKEGEQYYVFKVVEHQAQKVAVDVKYRGKDTIAVVSNELTPQDRVVIEGARLLETNDRINIL